MLYKRVKLDFHYFNASPGPLTFLQGMYLTILPLVYMQWAEENGPVCPTVSVLNHMLP